MAADAVDAALEAGTFKERPPSRTAEVFLSGGEEAPGTEEALGAQARRLGLDPREAVRLHHRYGTVALEVLDLVAGDASLAERLHPSLPYLRAEAEHAIRAEAAVRPDDILERRLRARLTARDRGVAALDWVCSRLADAHGWTPDRTELEADAYRTDVARDMGAERGPARPDG
jgi:glycerol-3-phosphate dehydrogenase